ncbi:MAG: hypothetical protein MOB07_02345 [Acidobacteria bacterium]|nr:hypothetical protein [Acidobacteriota bacterium]
MKQLTTIAVPSTRTPKPSHFIWLLHLFFKDHKRMAKIKRRCGGGESAIKVLYKVLESDKLPLTTNC